MNKIFYFLLISTICISGVFAQNNVYDMFNDSENIGQFTIAKTVDEEQNIITYSYEAVYTLELELELDIKDYIKTVYKNDTLIHFEVKTYLNGSNRIDIVQNYDAENNAYNRSVNKNSKVVSYSPLSYSFVNLFWEKPQTNMTDIYSELFNKYFDISSTENTVTVTDNRNRKQVFTYNEKGKLLKGTMKNALADITYSLKK